MLTQQKVEHIKERLEKFSQKHLIAYEIYAQGKCLVSYHPLALSIDKANWINRKRNSAIRFEMDTLDLDLKNKHNELAFIQKYGLSLKDYTLTPGAVCIKNHDGLLLGVVTVTGLTPQEDHEIAFQSIQD